MAHRVWVSKWRSWKLCRVISSAQAADPVTNTTGGTSVGDPTAGINDPSALDPTAIGGTTSGDRVGAGFLTAFVVCSVLGGLVWLSLPDGKV